MTQVISITKVDARAQCDGSIKCKQAVRLVVEHGNRRRLYCLPHARDAADNEISRMIKS